MGTAKLNISVIEKRMLKPSEAADYTGLPARHFKSTCPVRPVELRPGDPLYDKRDLDRWIDDMKEGIETMTRDDILDKLK